MSRFGHRPEPSPTVAQRPQPSPTVAPAPAPPEPEREEVVAESPGEVLFLVLSDVVQEAGSDTQFELASALTTEGTTFARLGRKTRKLFEKAAEMLWEEDEEDEEDEDDEDEDEDDE
jgi:cobalamin biosynthesis protein CobT